jgi:NAD(P)-dependent dehydrogenase (short-subunit alcohol dehydrogenase family)
VPERVALVTGASRGMGRAIALDLASGGARVMAVARDADRLAALHAEQPRIEALAVDLDTPEGCARAIEATRSQLGPISILVNNAGRGGWHDRPIWEQDRAGWAASLAINLDAPFELTRLAVADMLAARWGRIVMISSTAGQVGASSLGPYCASKHGVIGLMRSVAHDVAPFGITCNAVLPGWVRTEMAERDAEREAREQGVDVETVWAKRAAEYPAGRIVAEEEIAGVVGFLAGDAASAVNGEAITVALGSHW